MAKASDRRGFFSEVLRSGIEIAQEVSSAIRTAGAPEWEPEPEPWIEPRPVRAAPTSRPASADDFADYPLLLSRELTLPPAYSLQVEPLALEDAEFEAWIELRERLTQLQGVALEEGSTDWYALHRLFGHCEPVGGGEIELDCQLVA